MSRKAVRRLCIAAGVTLALLCGSQVAASAAPPGTNSAASEAAACAALYGVPANIGPDQLSACQWDMRAIGATPAGSYAVNRGAGARIGDIDTGIDLRNGDIMPNVDVANTRIHRRPTRLSRSREAIARTRLPCRTSPVTAPTPQA